MWLPNLWRLPGYFSARAQRKGNHLQAIKIANNYARLRPSDPQAWVLLSDAHKVAGDTRRAIEVAEEGHARVPDDVWLGVMLGDLLLSAGEMSRAADLLTEIDRRNPESGTAKVGLANLYQFQGRSDLATEMAAQAIERLGRNEDYALMLLALVSLGLPSQDEPTLHVLERAAKSPLNPFAVILLGLYWEENGDAGKASAYFSEFERRWKSSPEERDRVTQAWRRAYGGVRSYRRKS